MKRSARRLLTLLLCACLITGLLPVTALAANFPSEFYASVTYKYESNTKYEIFGTVTQSADTLTYGRTGEKMDRVVYGMEYAGGVFFTVEGNKLPRNEDDGLRELRMYNSDLSSYRTIGEVNQKNGNYWIIDTAMDISGAEPLLYGTYNSAFESPDGNLMAFTFICSIDLTDGHTSNYLQVTGLSSASDIIYAMAFDKEGKLYAIGADAGDDGGPASLYTISLGSNSATATKVGDIQESGRTVSTNWIQDLAFDHANDTLYWMENEDEILYTLDTKTAVATRVGRVSYALQAFCIPYDAAFAGGKHMVSVICEGAGEVTSGSENKTFYMVDSGHNLTLTLTPDAGTESDLLSVKVDGGTVTLDGSMQYTFKNVTGNHVIEVTFKKEIPAEQKTVTWLHYQGEPASFYTVDNVYKFYDLPYLDKEVPRDGYTQTLLDEKGQPIDDDEIILPGDYDVHVINPGNDKYAAMDVIYDDALQLGKCPGTPGRPVVYGKVGCTQGDLTTTSALQDYYGTDGTLIDAAHDEIPVTLVWLNPETTYNTVGNFYASATIYAAQDLDQLLLDCYNLDDGTPLTGGCQISARNTQVVVLGADEASLIKLQASDASGGTVTGKGVYKNGTEVTVTAAVNEDAGYEFKGWQEDGSVVSTDPTYTFIAEKDRTLTALFEVDEEYGVTLQTDPIDAGTVTGGGSYEEVTGHQATVEATPSQGYYFIGWYKDGQEVDKRNPYTFTVGEEGAALTAKFGVDYLGLAELAKDNLASALGTSVFEWSTLTQAVDAYEAAETFMKNLPAGVTDAKNRFNALTGYYSGVKELDLSNQDLNNDDLKELYLFTGVTELNLSGNRGISDLSALKELEMLETLDISNTGVTTLDSLITEGQSTFPGCKNLTAQNLSLTSISALAELVGAEEFDPDTVTKWDFTDSTLPDTEESEADVEAIKTTLGEKFIPPTIQSTPVIPVEPVNPGGSSYEDDGYSVSVPASTSIQGGAITVSPRSADKGETITITVRPDEGYELKTLTATDARGTELELTYAGNNRYTFTMPASRVSVAVDFQPIGAAPVNPFLDVSADAYYHDAVLWAVERGITIGTNPEGTLFSPDTVVTRAQMVTFLWRAYGSPRITSANPFTDVSADAYYHDAVLWAVERGITIGTNPEGTLFSPDAPVTRAQAVTFQWRAAGRPAVSGGRFDDVAADAYYASAVTWAAECGITVGTNAAGTLFSPDAVVTRAQAVTFLYRHMAQY